MKLFKVITEHDSRIVGRENEIILTEHFYASEDLETVWNHVHSRGSMMDLEIKGVIEVVSMITIL